MPRKASKRARETTPLPQEEAFGLQEHRHCPVCARPTPLDMNACSGECQDKLEASRRAQGRRTWIYLAIAVIMVLFLFLALPLLAGGPPSGGP